MSVQDPPPLGKSFLKQLASALRPYLRDESGNQNARKDFYSQKDSPLGRRAHLELVRSGALKGSKLGKLVLVRRDVMHEYIEAHEIETRSAGGADESDESDPLDDWGLERGTK